MSQARIISVATSVAPQRDVDLQRNAIRSWQALGWDVCSLNATTEAELAATQFPDLSFRTPSRVATKVSGKPLPFVIDLLRAAATHNPTAQVVGVINSDIYLRDQSTLTPALVKHCENGVVMLPRVDVLSAQEIPNFKPSGKELYSIGYDGVFMSPKTLALLPDSAFCIGMPFWDYWLPLIMFMQDKPLYAMQSAAALHVAHDTRWDQSVYIFFHALMRDALSVAAKSKTARNNALTITLDMLRHTYEDIFERATQPKADQAAQDVLASFYDRLQEVVVHHIKANIVPIHLAPADNVNNR